jgi:hypothetical protein
VLGGFGGRVGKYAEAWIVPVVAHGDLRSTLSPP